MKTPLRIERSGAPEQVVDINLGRGPTFEIASMLTEKQVPFLFVTGYDQAAIPPEYESVRRLEKPFKGLDLIELCALFMAHLAGANRMTPNAGRGIG